MMTTPTATNLSREFLRLASQLAIQTAEEIGYADRCRIAEGMNLIARQDGLLTTTARFGVPLTVSVFDGK